MVSAMLRVKYDEVLEIGFSGIKAKVRRLRLAKLCLADGDYQQKSRFLEAVMISCDAVDYLCETLCRSWPGRGREVLGYDTQRRTAPDCTKLCERSGKRGNGLL